MLSVRANLNFGPWSLSQPLKHTMKDKRDGEARGVSNEIPRRLRLTRIAVIFRPILRCAHAYPPSAIPESHRLPVASASATKPAGRDAVAETETVSDSSVRNVFISNKAKSGCFAPFQYINCTAGLVRISRARDKSERSLTLGPRCCIIGFGPVKPSGASLSASRTDRCARYRRTDAAIPALDAVAGT
jgi:hypothetical protein